MSDWKLFAALMAVMVLSFMALLGFIRALPTELKQPVIERPVFIPCAYAAWQDDPSTLEEMERRAAIARRMMEDCAADLYQARREK